MRRFGVVVGVVSIMSLVLWQSPAGADHQWGKYHWSQSSSPFTLTLIDSTTSPWTTKLQTASSDWSASSVLNTQRQSGDTSASVRQNCPPDTGKVRVCNYNYGNTGWLGVAQIWIYVGKDGHIAQGVAEMNDYYFGNSSYAYNNSAEMQHVICQEVAHTFGLDHQSEDGTSLNTCMDYYHNTSGSDTKSTHPNQGDYDQLQCIYDPAEYGNTISSNISLPDGGSYTHTCTGTGHLDSSKHGRGGGPPGGGPGGGPPNPSGRGSVIVSQVGQFWLVTFIYWR
jgi:hypothetical protein